MVCRRVPLTKTIGASRLHAPVPVAECLPAFDDVLAHVVLLFVVQLNARGLVSETPELEGASYEFDTDTLTVQVDGAEHTVKVADFLVRQGVLH